MIHLSKAQFEMKRFDSQQDTQQTNSPEMSELKEEESIAETNESQFLLSRENSTLMSLMREDSNPLPNMLFARENSTELFLARENSTSLSLGRENSANLSFTRENSTSLSLGREWSGLDVSQLITSANVHDLLAEHAISDEADQQHIGTVSDTATQINTTEAETIVPSRAEADKAVTHSVEETATKLDMSEGLQAKAQSIENDHKDESKNDAEKSESLISEPSASAREPRVEEEHNPKPSMRCWNTRASKRGAHVKGRPDMQKKARDGLAHWSKQLKLVRTAWTAKAAANPDFRAEFQSQIDLSVGRIKSKQECLLRVLQMATADGYIKAGPFGSGGFFGWTKFDVVEEHTSDFRRCIEKMFPAGFREDTLKETFRRSGLVPERWQWHLGWRGQVSWTFNARDNQ